jgi:hypothetical protein
MGGHHTAGFGLAIQQIRVLAGPCESRSPVHDRSIRSVDANEVKAEVNARKRAC